MFQCGDLIGVVLGFDELIASANGIVDPVQTALQYCQDETCFRFISAGPTVEYTGELRADLHEQ